MIFPQDATQLVGLPEGFTTRPARLEDAEMVVALYNAYSKDLLGTEEYRLSDTLAEWTLPGISLEETALLVFAPDGKLAGYGEWWDVQEPYVHKNLWYRVHPDFSGLGIAAYLITWAEGKARLAVHRAPAGARVSVRGNSIAPDQEMQQIFASLGYRHERSGLRMVIAFEEPPAAPQWPQGITVQRMVKGQDERRVIQAVYDSFTDHWGFVQEPFEAYYARWMHFTDHNEEFDPALWFLALDGEAVAGISLCYLRSHDDPQLGWVGTLGVCRPWRKRGLGLALLQHSFCELYRRGQRKVGLGVDSESLTGATRLYEKAGMRPDPTHTHLFYEKELRPGVELSTQHVD
jgi:GNAT superfamily N-acetyltransferase